MREIKFRGKTKDFKKWVYGGCVIIQDTVFIIDKTGTKTEVDPETVGQKVSNTFQELLKEGELYEGDVLEEDFDEREIQGCVYYNEGFGRFDLLGKLTDVEDGSHPNYPFSQFTSLNLAGNIHDNPELLEKVKTNDLL